MSVESESPASVFIGVTSHIVGRVFLVCASIVLAVFVGAAIACPFGDHIAPGGAVMLYPIMVFVGFYQLWGLLVYLPMIFVASMYILRGEHIWPILFIFALQAIEACRWCLSWSWTGAK